MVRLFGGSLGLPQVYSLRARVREWTFNSHFLPAFELTPQNVAEYVRVINQLNEPVLVGYVSAVRSLAEYMTAKRLRLNGLKSVICTAENMPSEWRQTIGQVLDAPVYCYYGCGEVNSIAYESLDEEGYLVCEEHIVLEAAQNDPTRYHTSGFGQACVTTLFNYAMPLIRYLNGDLLELTYANSGRAHQRISKLDGRVVDQLLGQDNHRVSGALVPHMVFRSSFPAWKYQVVQTRTDEIEFHYLPQDNAQVTSKTTAKLVSVLRDHLGSDLRVKFVVGQFIVPKSGKHRFVINMIED
jgi:phenylacetate-CoA ligase